MERKPPKKVTVRHKKNRKGEVVATLIRHAEPATEAAKQNLQDLAKKVHIPEWMDIPKADPPKPKPQNVADAWDAMKAAHDAPMWIRYQTVNPYRAEQDKRDLLAKLPLVNTSREYVNEQAYDPTRRVAPDVHQSSGPIIPLLAPLRFSGCPHLTAGGTSAINWMEHSQNIITGVCSNCPTQFDTRHPAHLKLFMSNPRAARNMGRAGQYNAPSNSVGQVYGTPWQIFVYKYFAWVYGIKPWLRAQYRAAAKYIRTDF